MAVLFSDRTARRLLAALAEWEAAPGELLPGLVPRGGAIEPIAVELKEDLAEGGQAQAYLLGWDGSQWQALTAEEVTLADRLQISGGIKSGRRALCLPLGDAWQPIGRGAQRRLVHLASANLAGHPDLSIGVGDSATLYWSSASGEPADAGLELLTPGAAGDPFAKTTSGGTYLLSADLAVRMGSNWPADESVTLQTDNNVPPPDVHNHDLDTHTHYFADAKFRLETSNGSAEDAEFWIRVPFTAAYTPDWHAHVHGYYELAQNDTFSLTVEVPNASPSNATLSITVGRLTIERID